MIGISKIFKNKEQVTRVLIVLFSLAIFLFMVYETRFFITRDTRMIRRWFEHIANNGWGGVVTANDNGGDYTTIWYIFVAIITNLKLYPELPASHFMKMAAMGCTLLSAVSMYFIAKHYRPKSPYLPTLSAVAILFMPAFLLDIFKTNFTDTVYIMFSMFSFLCFIKGKYGGAWFLLALGACFKPMAAYLAPFYIYCYFRDFNKYDLKDILAPLYVLLAVTVCSIPHVLCGGNFFDAVINIVLFRSGESLCFDSFTFWMFLFNENTDAFVNIAYATYILITAATIFFVCKYVNKDRRRNIELTVLPTLLIMLCHYFLPGQHETYFALATVTSLVGFIILRNKQMFIITSSLNVLLFFTYTWIGFDWWTGSSVFVNDYLIRQIMPMASGAVIIYMYCLIYKQSVFYNGKHNCADVRLDDSESV